MFRLSLGLHAKTQLVRRPLVGSWAHLDLYNHLSLIIKSASNAALVDSRPTLSIARLLAVAPRNEH